MRHSHNAGAAAVLLLALAGCRGGDGASRSAAAAGDTLSLEERRGIAGTLAFVSERDGDAEVYLLRPDGSGERRLTASPAADYPAAPSPDGSGLLVVSVMEDSLDHYEELALHPLAGGTPTPVAPRSARARAPSWAPDGGWLVFESDRASFRDLFRAGRDGGGARRLTDNREGNFEPAVSPDGGWIAFASSRDGDAEIYVMRPDGTEQRRLTAFHRDDWGAQWSPDGRWIAFLSNREGMDRVYLVRPDGSGIRRLRAEPDTSAARADVQEGEHAWSPDGTRMAYVTRTRAGTSRVHVADVRTGKRLEVGDGRGKDDMPAWSPDGRFLAFTSTRDGDVELYLARADGTGTTRLTRSPGPDWLPRWIPEARSRGADT